MIFMLIGTASLVGALLGVVLAAVAIAFVERFTK